MSRDIEDAARQVVAGAVGFAADMHAKGIHVGMRLDGAVRCVCCGDAWPCPGSRVETAQEATE